MKIAIVNKSAVDISQLLTACTWSGDKTQAARKLEFEFVQDDRDSRIPVVDIDNGYVVFGADDDGNIVFTGNVYNLKKDRAKSSVHVIAYDQLFVLNKSKTTKKFTDALPEDIAKEMCGEMGIAAGNIVATGEKVSFIANNKTGRQIIMGAYTEAHKKNEKQYQCIMNGDRLDVIEKGTLIEGYVLDSVSNMTDSIYSESIENIVNRVVVTDDTGNTVTYVDDEESIGKYPRIQAVYKEDKEKDTQTEAKDLFKEPEREGNVTVFGNYKLISGYSVVVKDTLFTGQFWIKADVHTFKDGIHETKLTLEFENIMNEEEVEHEKPQAKTSKTNKSGRTRKSDESNTEKK